MRILRHPGLLLASVVGLAIAMSSAPAEAENVTLSLPVGGQGYSAGPQMLGDAMVWAQREVGRTLIRQRASNGVTSTVLTIDDTPGQSTYTILVRSDEQVGVTAYSEYPSDRFSSPAGKRTWWAPPGGPFIERGACTTAVGASYVQTSVGPFDLGSTNQCFITATINGTGAAAGIVRQFPEQTVHVNGDLAAVVSYKPYRIEVQDWRTQSLVYATPTLAQAPYRLSLDQDGTIAYSNDATSESRVMVADPGHPVPRPAAVPTDKVNATGIVARGRIAWTHGGVVGLTTPDGTELARTASFPSVRELDFDGRHVTWATVSCGMIELVAWDVLAPLPPAPPASCAVPDVRAPSSFTARQARVDHRALTVGLQCPRRSGRCAGNVDWSTRDTGAGHLWTRWIDERPFVLSPGQSVRLSPRKSFRWSSRHPRAVTVQVNLDGSAGRKHLTSVIRVRRR